MRNKNDTDNLKNLQKILGYVFKSRDLLEEALTHRSYLNENPGWGKPHNERLEFLGDAVLELGVTKNLYAQYPKEPEGRLTSIRAALVNFQMLSTVAAEIDIERFLYMSRGEARDKGRARSFLLANAMESIIGAIYLDGGTEDAFNFIDKFIMPHLPRVLEKRLYKDPKSLLQEVMQNKNKVTPNYEVMKELGPDHDKIFTVAVYAGKKKLAEGSGPSKQEAELDAAKVAVEKLDIEEE